MSFEMMLWRVAGTKLEPVVLSALDQEQRLSGNEDVEVARATLRAGAFDYLGKPFRIDALARVVAAAVARPN